MHIISRSVCMAALMAASMAQAQSATHPNPGAVTASAWLLASDPAAAKHGVAPEPQRDASARGSNKQTAVPKTVRVFHGLAVCISLLVLVAATLARLKMPPAH
jgi:hypothetical protein